MEARIDSAPPELAPPNARTAASYFQAVGARAATPLTSSEEAALGARIAAAERALLEAIVGSPSGAHALGRLAGELDRDEVDLRDILLNPDEEGLDLEAVRREASTALASAESARARGAEGGVAGRLASLRLATDLVARLVSAVRAGARGAAESDERDRAAIALIEDAQRDLRESKQRLVVGNLRLVVLFARRYAGRGLPLLDLVQEGNVGLLRAADKFDYRRGFRFSTYASWWIKQALQRALLDRTLRLPVHVADDRRRVGRVRGEVLARERREPDVRELAQATGLSAERVAMILALPAQPASLDAPLGDESDQRLSDFIPSEGPFPEDEALRSALAEHLDRLLEGLSPRERTVVRLRFGLGHGREHTLEEVGRELSLTRERIRQIERAALLKLRTRSEPLGLASFLHG